MSPRTRSPYEAWPSPDALAVFERCRGRPLTPAKSASARRLTEDLQGVPGLVVEAARAVRDGVCELSDLAERPAAELERRRVLALSEAQRRLLALLAELSPAAMPAALAASEDGGEADLRALERVAFAQSGSPRHLARPLTSTPLPAVDPVGLLERVAAGGGGDGDGLREAAPSLVAALEWGQRAGALDTVVDAARAVEGGLLRCARTGAWGAALECGASAARDSGRAGDEAYFLHQQGTRWLTLGRHEIAEENLLRALELRERLGDRAGAAATHHNFDELRRARIPPKGEPRVPPSWGDAAAAGCPVCARGGSAAWAPSSAPGWRRRSPAGTDVPSPPATRPRPR